MIRFLIICSICGAIGVLIVWRMMVALELAL